MKKTIRVLAIILNLVLVLSSIPAYAVENNNGSSGNKINDKQKDHPWSRLKTTKDQITFLEAPRIIEIKQSERVVEALGIKAGDFVADVGAGTGVFTFVISKKVGDKGRVFATDILDGLLNYIDQKRKEKNINNIVLIKSTDTKPGLPEKSCDKIILVDVFVHLNEKEKFMSELSKALKDDGTMTIVGRLRHRPEEVIAQVTKYGFEFKETHDFLKKHNIIVFKASSGRDAVASNGQEDIRVKVEASTPIE